MISKEARTTVSADEENSVKFLGFFDKVGQLLRLFPEFSLFLMERHALGVFFEVLDRTGVQWCDAASWRSYGDVGMRGQHVIGVSELGLRSHQRAVFAVVRNGCSPGTTRSISRCRRDPRGR